MNFQLEARALPIALVIVAISGIVTLAFVERLSLEHDQFVRQTSIETSSLAARSAINWLLAYGNEPAIYGESLQLPHSQGKVKGRVWSFPWGTYRYLAAEVIDPINGDTIVCAVLAGAYPNSTVAITLPAAGDLLRTSGTVRIGGDLEVPTGQIGNFSSPEFDFNQFEHIGEKRASSGKNSFPELSEIFPDWDALFASNWPASLHPIRLIELENIHELSHIRCDQLESLAIITHDSISITPDFLPPNTILQGPSITFLKGRHQPVQVFCGRRATLLERAYLPYPSVVLLKPDESVLPNEYTFITLEREATIEGSILTAPTLGKKMTQVQLLPDSKVVGEIIANGNLSLGGDVFGSVVAGSMDRRLESGETVRNLIADVEVSLDRRTARFLTPIGQGSSVKLDVIDSPIPILKQCP